MGNRAVICFSHKAEWAELETRDPIGVYLHWNGGRDSVEGFLKAARELKLGGDKDYTVARFVQMVANFFGGTSSIGVGKLSDLDCDNGDNGLYVVDPTTLEVIGRHFFEGEERWRGMVRAPCSWGWGWWTKTEWF